MRWWITGMVKRLGTPGALENLRTHIEAERFRLERVEALARRLDPPRRTIEPDLRARHSA